MATASDGAAFDQSQFWALYDEALPRIYGYLVRRSDRATAEDLTQEVFSTLARTMSTGSTETVSMAWLFTVARHRLFDHLRSRERDERKREMVWASRSAGVATVEQSYDQRTLGERTRAALEALPAPQRAALVLHHADDMSVADLAAHLGKSVSATESLLARARRAFREALEQAEDAEEVDHG